MPEIVQMAFSLFGYSVTSLHTKTESKCPILQAEDVHTADLMKYSCVMDSLTGNGVSCLVDRSCKSCQQQLEANLLSGEDAYGHVLGMVLVCCWV